MGVQFRCIVAARASETLLDALQLCQREYNITSDCESQIIVIQNLLSFTVNVIRNTIV